MLANDVFTLDEMDDVFKKSNTFRKDYVLPAGEALPNIKPPGLPIICIPTTLSAGEFNPPGGATHDETKHKQLFFPPNHRGPQILIMDPALTQTTPERVWLSTGLRAVDHCVETICSSNAKMEGTEASLKGIHLLIPGLLRIKRNADDSRARLSCQLGAAESMKASVIYGVHVGECPSCFLLFSLHSVSVLTGASQFPRRVPWYRPPVRPHRRTSRRNNLRLPPRRAEIQRQSQRRTTSHRSR